jgi:hypothetical protein
MSSRPQAVTVNVQKMTARTRELVTVLNLHWAGVALLSVVCLYLLASMIFAYQRARGADAAAITAQRNALMTAKIQAQPLLGLDAKLQSATNQADQFYLERLPVSYSEFLTELGALAKKQGVRLTRVQYAPSQVTGESAGQLTQVQMDAGLTGQYRALVTFINGLERDRTFFVIGGVTLTGQQTGLVNLRIRIATYLRNPLTEAEKQRLMSESTAEEPASKPENPAGVTP